MVKHLHNFNLIACDAVENVVRLIEKHEDARHRAPERIAYLRIVSQRLGAKPLGLINNLQRCNHFILSDVTQDIEQIRARRIRENNNHIKIS